MPVVIMCPLRRPQPRLVTPHPSRLRHPRRGDVLVTLSRGLAGKHGDHKDIAHDLDLYRWGDQAVGFWSDLAFRGKVLSISHLVTASFLDESAQALLRRAGKNALVSRASSSAEIFGGPSLSFGSRLVRECGVTTYSGPYEVKGTSGYLQRFLDDEYIHVEHQSNGSQAVMWSTLQDCRTFLQNVSAILPEPQADQVAEWVAGTEEHEDTSVALLGLIESEQVRPELVNIDYSEGTIFWRTAFRKLVDSKEPREEGAILFGAHHAIKRRRLRALLIATGSPVVRRLAEEESETLDRLLRSQTTRWSAE